MILVLNIYSKQSKLFTFHLRTIAIPEKKPLNYNTSGLNFINAAYTPHCFIRM